MKLFGIQKFTEVYKGQKKKILPNWIELYKLSCNMFFIQKSNSDLTDLQQFC